MENLIIEALKDTNRARGELILSLMDDVTELKERTDRLERTNVRLIKVIRRREAMIDRLVTAETKKK